METKQLNIPTDELNMPNSDDVIKFIGKNIGRVTLKKVLLKYVMNSKVPRKINIYKHDLGMFVLPDDEGFNELCDKYCDKLASVTVCMFNPNSVKKIIPVLIEGIMKYMMKQ